MRRCATRWSPRSQRRATPAGTASLRASARTSTTSGRTPTSSSTATPSCSRRSGSRSSTRCRPVRVRSSARSRRRGSRGPGYDGHTFWDAERFVLPVLTYTVPNAARDALRWRHSTLDLARERARQLGLAGAAFPWRTIRGQECSGYWPAGTAAFHIAARHRRRRRPLSVGDGRRVVRARGRPRAPRRDRAALALARSPRRAGPVPHRRRDRARRVQRDRGQQRLHEPLAQRNLRAAADAVARHPRHAAAARRRSRGGCGLARRRHDDGHPLGRRARRPSTVGGLHRARALEFRGTRRTPIRCFSTTPTSSSTASRS